MNYVYSTLSCNHIYCSYVKSSSGENIVEKKVLIEGGANVAHGDIKIHTPKGKVTAVTDEELAICEKDYVFQMHIKNGFIIVDRKKAKMSDVLPNMTEADKSAPITPASIEKENKERLKKTKG